MSDLLEQAIADAKAIRDAAIENAKATLAESFEPQIKSMIKARLMEQGDLDSELDETYSEDEEYSEDDEMQNEVNLDEIMDELQNEIRSSRVDEDLHMMLEELEDDLYEEEASHLDSEEDEEILEGMLDEIDDNLDEDILEGILYEIDEQDELHDIEQDLADLEEQLSDEQDEDELEESSWIGSRRSYLFENDDEDSEMPEEEPEMMDEDEDVLPDLDELTPEEVDELSKPEMKQILLKYLSGHQMSSATGESDEVPSEEEVREAVEAVLAEMHPSEVQALEEAVLGPIPNRNNRRQSSRDYKAAPKHEVNHLQNQLRESNQAVRELQDTLNEVGIVNSKLLYTGKLFRAHNNLSEKQKVTILEYFDRVNNLEDVKSLYSKFVRALNNRNASSTSISKGASSVNSAARLTESNASRTAGDSTRPTQILQEDRMIARWQQLAGIIK